ncbi:MAG: LTA synthase family protein [Ruminiclostridium sp.]|nr:LTA synthase family protein [Ruminiclostridium sp.]
MVIILYESQGKRSNDIVLGSNGMKTPLWASMLNRIKNNIKYVLTITALILAGVLDIFFESNISTFLVMIFLLSVPVFLLGLNHTHINNKTLLIFLVLNLGLLLFTYQDRIYYVNIFMLSFILWQFVTPFVIKHKGLISMTVLFVFITVYLTQLYGLKIPLFPFVFYPLYLLGYNLGNMSIKKTNRILLPVCANIVFSAAFLAFFFYKTLRYTIKATLVLLPNNTPDPLSAVYLPFGAVFLIWFFISIYILAAYFFKASSSSFSYKDGYEGFIKKLAKDALYFTGFFGIAGILLFIGEYAIRGSFKETLSIITDPPAMFNLLCLGSIFLFLLSLMGKTLSTIITGILMGLLTIANFIKIKYFNEPFYPWDTYLIREAITISKEYVNLPLLLVILILLLCGLTVFIAIKKPVRSFIKPKLILPMIPVSITMLLVTGMLFYSPQELAKLNITKSWYIGKDEMLSNGLLVQSLLYIKDYDKYVLSVPEGYSKETMEEISRRLLAEFPSEKKSSLKPNIILIMDESFWNPAKLKGVTFSSNIMEGYDKYKKGETISPAIGGGTANVEFEALTGLTDYFLGSGVLAYNVYFRRDTPGIVSVMKENGYSTTAIHPFLATMYNRNKVYKYLQFDKFITVDEFNVNTDLKGPYVSDDKLMDKVLEILAEGSEPKFIFALSMQNHDPYANKYPKLDVTVKSEKLNASELGILSTYSQGVSDGAKALDKLIKALEKSKTPTLVYFFGDHLPRLGSLKDMLDIYERLNPESDKSKKAIRSYSTPYASWSNYKETRAFSTPFSPSHIAYEILKDSGVDYPSYFNILKALEKDHLILQRDISGQVDINNQYIKDYRLIQYDIILGKQYLLGND